MPTVEEQLAAISDQLKKLEAAKNAKSGFTITTAGKFLISGTVIMGAIGAIVIYLAVNKQIEKANDKVTDLLVRIAVLQEHTTQVEKQFSEADAIVQRLQKEKPDDLKQILDLFDDPRTKQLLQSGQIEHDMVRMTTEINHVDHDAANRDKALAQQIGTFFDIARNAGYEARLDPAQTGGYFAEALATISDQFPDYQKQALLGEIAPAPWATSITEYLRLSAKHMSLSFPAKGDLINSRIAADADEAHKMAQEANDAANSIDNGVARNNRPSTQPSTK